MDEQRSVCKDCPELDSYLSGQIEQMPCLVCDRLWCEVTLVRSMETTSGGSHVRSSWPGRAAVRVGG